ncbi:hypothetical protein [Brevundimonas sp.]|uniref:hypothetical protein n=1 Tax=Brevundimonas sp. TaxID=1871086 RepID=UPI003A952F0F
MTIRLRSNIRVFKANFPFSGALASRGMVLTAAYVSTSAVVLIAAITLGKLATPAISASVLSVFFISVLSSGLEPGTAKSLLVQGIGSTLSKQQMQALALASAVKALVASIPLAVLWRISDQNLHWEVMVWLPLIVLSGFITTDFRVLLDAQGRYALAIWLKQSGLIVGFASLACLVSLGVSLEWALAVSTLARLGLTAAGIGWCFTGASANINKSAGTVSRAEGWLTQRSWMAFTTVSVLAALSGSLDRVIALRLLSPANYNAYFIIYEIVTKLWLLPYLAAPILFAQRATGRINKKQLVAVHVVMAFLGLIFATTVLAAAVLAPSLFQFVTGLDRVPIIPLGAFTLAIVLSSFCQLVLVDVQARGLGRSAIVMTLVSLAASAPIFYTLVYNSGLEGLLWAWLIKSSLELIMSVGVLLFALDR